MSGERAGEGPRKVVVVGASSGIGRACAERLLERGAEVAIVARRGGRLAEITRRWPDRASAIDADLRDPGGRDQIVPRAIEALGTFDGLIYAAGVAHHRAWGAIEEAALHEQIEVNLIAALRIIEAALPRIDAGGSMVVLTSTLGLRPIAESAVYSATKAGLSAVVKSAALAGAPRQVRINAVSPGVVATEMIQHRAEEDLRALAQKHALGRFGEASEVARVVLDVMSAPWMTGSEVVLDGGLLLS
ncbi:MAG TPA: SDR family oxidoreductase [Polyangiaceae bacterium]|jgi:NAD(P)-dependent dehydrogenase (short-subunit alcohol dehydrogenase family)|nr:SDR family oxidoreductase [Polyangiaceae bacterium]